MNSVYLNTNRGNIYIFPKTGDCGKLYHIIACFCVDIDVFLNFVFLSISNGNVYFAKMVYLWQIISHYCTFCTIFGDFLIFGIYENKE